MPYSAPQQRPGEDHQVTVNVLDGVLLVVWSLLGQFLVASIIVVAMTLAGIDVQGLDAPSLGALTVVSQSLTLAGALAWLAGRGRLSWRLLGSRRPDALDVLRGLGGGVVATVVAFTILLGADAVLGPLESPDQALLDDAMLSGTALLLTLVATGLLAPVLEEVTFRSVLFQSLGRRVGLVGGVLYSSVFFAIVHVEVLFPFSLSGLVFVVALGALGVVFAMLFNRSRNLLVPVIAHAVYNVGQVLLAASGGGVG